MKSVRRSVAELGPELSFAAEYWISAERITHLSGSTKLFDIARLIGRGSTGREERPIFLDTNAANNGLLNITGVVNGRTAERTSHKKVLSEGHVIMSRLRPYLRQIAFIPIGFFELMGCSDVLCSTEFYALEPIHPSKSIAFLVPWLLSAEIQDIFQQATTGGHHPRFERDLLSDLCIPDRVIAERTRISKDVAELSRAYVEAQLQMRDLVQKSSSSSARRSSSA